MFEEDLVRLVRVIEGFMSLPKYSHFKFEVGQFVRSSFCALDEKRSSSEMLGDTYQVVERMYQECPGGVQLHYLCRPQGFLSSKEYMRLSEIELIPMPQDSSR